MSRQAHIVTLYNSSNCGAYLQAWALGRAVSSYSEGEVAYIDTGARSTRRMMFADLRSSVRKGSPGKALFAVRKARSYAHALRLLKVEHHLRSFPVDDILIFGSDEIWNVSRSRMIAAYPMLWGEKLSGGKRIAYAPSSNGSVLDAFPGFLGFRESLIGFDALSARDEWTALEVSRITGRSVSVVCDPTLLLGVEEYNKIQMHTEIRAPYMLIYSYGREMTKEDIKAIQTAAKLLRLRTVSADNWLPWCDESVPCGPRGFLGLLDGAEVVVTDTFHGTVFSTIYRKRFASFARANDKVVDYLARVGLSSCDASRMDLNEIFERDDDWAGVENNIAEFKSKSNQFLVNALKQ